jgi:FlaA1/EpsC-like NDP-sugar epimerase
VIRLSGFEPGADIQIEFSGVRPGEKMFEEPSFDSEDAIRTRHRKVWICRNSDPSWLAAHADVQQLLTAADVGDRAMVRRLIVDAVPEFTGTDIPAIDRPHMLEEPAK